MCFVKQFLWTAYLLCTLDGLGGATIIISREETITKVDLTCLATNASCIDPSTWEFLGVAFGDQGLLPGARYLANIHSSTGPTESQETVIQNIQSKLEMDLFSSPEQIDLKNVGNCRYAFF